MADRSAWTYREVEGALYSLGRAVESRSMAQSLPPGALHGHAHRSGSRDISQRVDFACSVRGTLDDEEMTVVRDHYILGARTLRGREGYRRREQIIKKLVAHLNGG